MSTLIILITLITLKVKGESKVIKVIKVVKNIGASSDYLGVSERAEHGHRNPV